MQPTRADIKQIRPLQVPYEAPSYLVEPTKYRWYRNAIPEGTVIEVLDDHVVGWGDYTAIVRVHWPDNNGWDDALATFRERSER